MTVLAPALLTADDFNPAAAALTFDPGPHVYRVGMSELPSVTGILRACGISTDFERLVERGLLKAAVLEEKRDIGHAVHQATHFFDEGELRPDSVDVRVAPYLEAWKGFRNATGFVPRLLETPLHHPERLFAGTLDRAGTFTQFEGSKPTDLHIVDIKCGDPEDAAARWQTCFYAELLSVSLRADVLFQSGGAAAFLLRPRYSVQLHDTGRWKLSIYRDYLRDWDNCQAFLKTFSCQAGRRDRC